MDEIGTRLRRYIRDEVLFEDELEIEGKTPLLERLDSLGLLKLVAFIEEEFDTEIPDAELVATHFATPDSVERLVRSHVGAAGGL